MGHDLRVLGISLLGGAPALALALYTLWTGDINASLRWTVSTLLVAAWLGAAVAVRSQVVRPLQTSANLLAALREGDFSIRARGARPDDPLGLLLVEINTLAATLKQQRLGAVEASALLAKVIEEIDVAIFAFDGDGTLRLTNPAGARLLGRPGTQLLGRAATDLGLGDCLHGDSPRLLDSAFSGAAGRWELRRTSFRQEGLPHQLVVLTDLSRALREEERQAWKRLIRVLSHEINNSLAPIKSLAGSLRGLVTRERPPPDWRQDLESGLGVIAGRADALARFMASYARLARLPEPRTAPVPVREWVERVARLETRKDIEVRAGPEITCMADSDQLDQLLINLLNNAVDASLETGGGVRVGWDLANGQLEVWVEDDGPGLPESANLFVPFFTTKPKGSGIGLVLSRQIAEAHGGTLTLENARTRGCVARLRLPLAPVAAASGD